MSEAVPATSAWPWPRARLAGVLYLINIAGCMFAEVAVRGRLIVGGDAAATAANISAHAQLFRLGVVAELIAVASFVAAAAFFYEIFKPVSRSLSLLAASFGIAEGAIHGLNLVHQLVALVALEGAPNVSAFAPEQLQALAYAALSVRVAGFHICMVFFGLYFLALGSLVFASGFLPRLLGVVVTLGGLSCLMGGFTTLLAPASAGPFMALFLAPFGLARVFLAVWLVALGVNVPRWEALAAEGVRP